MRRAVLLSNRCDKTRLELFLASARGWEIGLLRPMAGATNDLHFVYYTDSPEEMDP